MEIVLAIKHKYPDANNSNLEVIAYPDGTFVISKWDLPLAMPSIDEIETYWTEHQQEILAANKPVLSEFDKLKKDHTNLMFQLMTKGVI